jgi:serine/threonine protein kinase
MEPITSETQTGRVLAAKYRLGEIIGHGGMGVVYEAVFLAIHRRVAVKIIHSRHGNEESIKRRLQHEARVAGSIGHDNVCEIIDLGETEEGLPFIVMPLLRGQPLSQMIARQKLPTASVVDIVSQILSALSAVHAKGIIHRDLKPANVFITSVGDRNNFVKLLDFGISKLTAEESPSDLTGTGFVLGTPHYMSPEQARGVRNIDSRTDIYAVGVILYEMLTGILPYTGESYNEILYQISTKPFPLPSSRDPSIPRKLEEVILTAMSKDPTDRFDNAEKMRIALTGLQDSVSVLCDSSFSGDGFVSEDSLRTMTDLSPVIGVVPVESEPTREAPVRTGAALRRRWFYLLVILLGVVALGVFGGLQHRVQGETGRMGLNGVFHRVRIPAFAAWPVFVLPIQSAGEPDSRPPIHEDVDDRALRPSKRLPQAPEPQQIGQQQNVNDVAVPKEVGKTVSGRFGTIIYVD